MPRAVLIVAATVLLTVSACGGESTSKAIDVGYAYGMDVGDIGDVLALQALEEGGVASSPRDMGGNSQSVVALTRGDVQLAQVSTEELLSAIAAGAEVKAVLGQNMVSEIVLVGGPGIDRVQDLRGKTVAAGSPGGTGDNLLTAALEAAGMTRDDIDVVYVDESTTRAAAFAAGRSDALVFDYVDYELLRQREPGDYTLLDRAAARLPQVPALTWAVNTSWADKNEDLLREIVEGLLSGYEDVYTAEGGEAWVREAKADFLADEPDEVVEGIYDFYSELGMWPTRSSPVTEAKHDEAVRQWVESDQIAGPVAFDDAWLIDYWRDAAD